MNILPAFALLVARKQGDSNSDAARAALMSAVVQPPMTGFLIGTVMAANAGRSVAAPLPAPPPRAAGSISVPSLPSTGATRALSSLTVHVSPTSIANDGRTSATVVAQALDGAGAAMRGVPVNFSADAGGAISPASAAHR